MLIPEPVPVSSSQLALLDQFAPCSNGSASK
jgi:hypothetical protein